MFQLLYMKEKNINNIVKEVNKLIDKKKYSEAIFHLEDLDKMLKDNYYIKMNLGACYNKTENFNKALDIYNSAIELPEKDSELYYNIGNVYFSMKDYKESINFYDMAIKDNSTHSNSYISKGSALFMSKKYLESYKLLIHFYSKFTEDFKANFTIAGNLMYLGKMKDALPYINKCISKDPNNVGLRRLMAIVYGHMGWINESEECYVIGNGMIVFHDDKKDFEIIEGLESKG